jgi:hypothetical protein
MINLKENKLRRYQIISGNDDNDGILLTPYKKLVVQLKNDSYNTYIDLRYWLKIQELQGGRWIPTKKGLFFTWRDWVGAWPQIKEKIDSFVKDEAFKIVE